MKQFLRYQISGMVFILWLLIFYYSGENNSKNFIKAISDSILFTNKVFYTFISALPIGVILHQISVNIKNHIFTKICPELDDWPKQIYIEKLIKREEVDIQEYIKYILDRISNLNSFYYVRFDNGFLAPFLAFVIIAFLGYTINPITVIVAIVLGYTMLYYIPRICKELKIYYSMI